MCVIKSRACRSAVVVLKPLQTDLKLCLQPGAAAGVAFPGCLVLVIVKTNLATPEIGHSRGLMVQEVWGKFDEKVNVNRNCRMFVCTLYRVWLLRSRLQWL